MTEETAEHKKKRDRSPGYPGINLEKAIAKASILYREEGKHAAPVEVVLKHWGFPPKSSPGFIALSTLKKFGLLVDEGTGKDRAARISEDAFQILVDDVPNSTERLRLIQKAGLLPTIHKEIWDQYNGNFPSDSTVKVWLRNKGFTEKAAIDCIQEFHETLAYTKLTASDKMPPKAENKTQPEGELQMAPTPTIPTPAPAEPTPPTTQTAHASPPVTTTQTNRTVQIPLTGAPWALLQIPYPMTDANWAEMEEFLKLMRKPLTTAR